MDQESPGKPEWRAAELVNKVITDIYSELAVDSVDAAENFLDALRDAYDSGWHFFETREVTAGPLLISMVDGREVIGIRVQHRNFRIQMGPDSNGRPFVLAIFEGSRPLASGTMS